MFAAYQKSRDALGAETVSSRGGSVVSRGGLVGGMAMEYASNSGGEDRLGTRRGVSELRVRWE
jgi:hypothetical protein